MNVEQRLSELEKIQRPFSHPFPATESTAYFIDNVFAFRIGELNPDGRAVRFVADMQLSILREHAKKNREERHGIGIGLLLLTFTSFQRVVYLGDKYKFSLRQDQDYFLLQSANPINFEPVPKNIDLRALVAQGTSSANI